MCLAGFETSLDEYTSGAAAKAYLKRRLPAMVVVMMMIASIASAVISASTVAWVGRRNGGSRSSQRSVGPGQRVARVAPDAAGARPGSQDNRGREEREEGDPECVFGQVLAVFIPDEPQQEAHYVDFDRSGVLVARFLLVSVIVL